MNNATTTKTALPTAKQTTCKVEGCERKIQARKMCVTHYGQWHRAEGGKERTYTCIECGNALRNKASQKRGTCSNACELTRLDRSERAGAKKHTCPACGGNFWTNRKKKYCCQRCANSAIARSRAVDRGGFGHRLKSAIDLGAEDVLSLLREESTIVESGCWEFACPPSSVYPSVAMDGKVVMVHRISLEAKIGAPLGVQAAHHMCANAKCVNPDHLQPVTYRDNTAEMLARNSYIRRIRELEDAIRSSDPANPVLDRAPMAGV